MTRIAEPSRLPSRPGRTACNAAPQSPQNFSAGSFDTPHRGHFKASAGNPPARICEGEAEWLNYSTTAGFLRPGQIGPVIGTECEV